MTQQRTATKNSKTGTGAKKAPAKKQPVSAEIEKPDAFENVPTSSGKSGPFYIDEAGNHVCR